MDESEDESASETAGKSDDNAVCATLRERLGIAIDATSESRASELSDLKFYAASPDNNWQWPEDVMRTRGGESGAQSRPSLTINKLPQHVRQITNDQRQNRPAGKVLPVDDAGDPEIAEIYNGMIRSIEALSNAGNAYNTACDNQTTFGEGYWRIVTQYVDDTAFEQEVRIVRIRNSFSVYMDPLINDPCGEDARWCILTEDMPHTEYERTWPDAKKISSLKLEGVNDPQWLQEKTIRIAEYFYFEYAPTTLCLFPGDQKAFKGTPEYKQLVVVYGKPLRSRRVERAQVKWVKSNGFEILETTDWLGSYIPVVRVVGNEFEVEGQLHVSGIVRNAKDAQRLYNYWTSNEAEMLALAPKAPFVGYAGQFKGFEKQWKTANTVPWPYLEINPDATDAKGTVLPLPERQMPPMAQQGLLQAKLGASEDLKATTGQYDASLGMVSNERSGKAIVERKRETDTGTYHYVDNLAQAIRYSTKQIVELIPKVYDTPRIARIVGLDNEIKMVRLDPSQPDAVRKVMDENGNVIEKVYNPGVGKYDVVPTTGPSYETKRVEARENMAQILQASPELWQSMGDLFVKEMDWPGAQEMAKRFRRMVPPELLDEDDNPALKAANQKMEAMGQEMQQMHDMLQKVATSMEARELDIKRFEADIKAFDAETKRLATVSDSLTPDQVQDIVRGTIDAAVAAGDLIRGRPEMEETPT